MDRCILASRSAIPGLLTALLAACQAVPIADGASTQANRFTLTGVVEGFYGPPWSHQDRLDMLAFMGRVGLNAYFYAPKNDPYHRDRWREPYPAEERERLRELVHAAQRHTVDFWYAISPGLSMTYSSEADYADLITKIDSVGRLGVRHIGLFVDDVLPNLTSPEDRETFASLADAHIALINRLHDDLGSRGMALSVTPTTYSDAWGDQTYLAHLGAGVNNGVPFFWTGPDIASRQITTADASRQAERTRRAPFVWDNYPVNDFARWRLFLGPVRERSADLASVVAGFTSNPMNEAHASMIPLYTIAAYTRDPKGYQPATAGDSALHQLYGPDAALALRPFIEIYGDDAWGKNLFEPLYFLPDDIDLEPMRTGIRQLEQAIVDLRSLTSTGMEPLGPLISELEPFVRRTRARVAQLASDQRYDNREGHLRYRTELDRIAIPPTRKQIRVDGETDEWEASNWRPLVSSRAGSATVRLAAAVDADRAYIAIDVPIPPSNVKGGPQVGEGDHVALIIDADPRDGHINETDLFVLASAPGGTPQSPLVLSMGFHGFMSKFLADNEALTFNEFHVTTFGRPPHANVATLAQGIQYEARHNGRGYTAEIAIPLAGRDRIRFSVTVTATRPRRTVFSWSRRNYPANPETFGELLVVKGER